MTHSMKRIVTLVPYKVTWKDGPNYGKDAHGFFNDDTVKFLRDRYVVLRNVIPKEIITFALDTWKTIEAFKPAQDIIFDEEKEPIPESPKSSHHTSRGGHTTPMGVAMHRWLHKELQKRIDMGLHQTYSYTRKYERGAYLRAHTDRPACEVSATLCLGYQSDDGKPWKIWLDNTKNWVDIGTDFNATQGIPIRRRKNAICVDLEVGDLLLYQGPNVVHWRDTFIGDYSYHMFLHYTAGASKLEQCGNYNINPHGEYSTHVQPVLQYDGRHNPYQQKEAETCKEEYTKWMNEWEHLPNKADFVNNYDHFEFEKIEE